MKDGPKDYEEPNSVDDGRSLIPAFAACAVSGFVVGVFVGLSVGVALWF